MYGALPVVYIYFWNGMVTQIDMCPGIAPRENETGKCDKLLKFPVDLRSFPGDLNLFLNVTVV